MATHPEPEPTPTAQDPCEAVRREAVLDAPPAVVWEQLASGEGLGGWLADEVDVEVRSGARGTVRDAGGPERPVEVEDVVPGRRLSLAWRDEEDRPTLVDIALEAVPRGRAGDDGPQRTRVVVVEVPAATLELVGIAADRLRSAPGGASGPATPLALARA